MYAQNGESLLFPASQLGWSFSQPSKYKDRPSQVVHRQFLSWASAPDEKVHLFILLELNNTKTKVWTRVLSTFVWRQLVPSLSSTLPDSIALPLKWARKCLSQLIRNTVWPATMLDVRGHWQRSTNNFLCSLLICSKSIHQDKFSRVYARSQSLFLVYRTSLSATGWGQYCDQSTHSCHLGTVLDFARSALHKPSCHNLGYLDSGPTSLFQECNDPSSQSNTL